VAYELKDADLLLSAATKAYRLRPQDSGLANNFAAALLVNRVQPEEAIKMTMQLMAKAPESAAARINHSMALVQNKRFSEAISNLEDIRLDRLTAGESTAYNLARLESYLGLQQADQARKVIDRIDPKYLFPNQVQWLEKVRQQISPNNQVKP
jgi:predicted Zn-dependent protease